MFRPYGAPRFPDDYPWYLRAVWAIEDAWDCVLGFLWWCLGYVYGFWSSLHK